MGIYFLVASNACWRIEVIAEFTRPRVAANSHWTSAPTAARHLSSEPQPHGIGPPSAADQRGLVLIRSRSSRTTCPKVTGVDQPGW